MNSERWPTCTMSRSGSLKSPLVLMAPITSSAGPLTRAYRTSSDLKKSELNIALSMDLISWPFSK